MALPIESSSSSVAPIADPQATTPVASGEAETHLILPGETLPSIANAYGVTVPDLQAANPDVLNPDVLYPGDTLVLPANAKAPDDRQPSAQDLLRDLQAMPRPSIDDVPVGFPQSVRESIHATQVADWLERRAALANEALQTPQFSDFDKLPPGERETAHDKALADLDAARPQLEALLHDTEIERLESDPTFQSLSLDAQSLVRFALGQLTPGTDDFAAMLQIGRSPGLAELTDDEQLKFMLLMNADGSQLGHQGALLEVEGGLVVPFELSVLQVFASRHGLTTGNGPVTDPAAFRDFIDNNPTGIEEPFPTDATVPYDIGEPAYTNEVTLTDTGWLPLVTYNVDIDGRTVVVKVVENPPPELNLPTVEQIVQALAALPPESRGVLNEVAVEGRASFDHPDAYMTIADGDVRVYPGGMPSTTEGVLGALVHETAHVLDDRMSAFDTIRWVAAMATDRIDASDYARKNLAEDFAETYRLYMSVRGTPDETEARSLMPERFAILDEMFA